MLIILVLLLTLLPMASMAQAPTPSPPPTPQKPPIDIAMGLAGLATGDLAGSIVTWLLTRRRQRIEVALKLVDFYLSTYFEYAGVRGLLMSNVPLNSRREVNRVRKMDKWFEIVIILSKKKIADARILREIELGDTIISFRQGIEAKSREVTELEDMLSQCKHLKGFSTF